MAVRRMTPVREYIQSNLDRDLSIEEIAAQACLSASRLSHLFKDAFDTSIGQYINQLQLQTAEQLLLTEPLTVKEISARVGFNDQGYFRRRFKAAYGQPPSEYREARLQNKQDSGEEDEIAGLSQ